MTQNVLDSGGLGYDRDADESEESEADEPDDPEPMQQDVVVPSPVPSVASKHALEPDAEGGAPVRKRARSNKLWYCVCRPPPPLA